MRILLGAQMKKGSDADSTTMIYKNAEKVFAKDATNIAFPVTAEGNSDKTEVGKNNFPKAADTPEKFRWVNMTNGKRGQEDTFADDILEAGVENRIRFFWEEKPKAGNEAYDANTLVISPNRFPGTSTRGSKAGMPNQFSELLGLLRA